MAKNQRKSNSLKTSLESVSIAESQPLDYSYSRRVLSSGLTLVQVNQPHLHTGTVAAYISAGSRFETAKDNGLSHFLEHMVFRGTRGHPGAFEFNKAVEKIGGTLFAATCPDATEYMLSLPSENLPHGVGLLAELITDPIFGNLEVERRIIVEEKKEDLDEHGKDIDIDDLSRRKLWPKHSLGQSVIGPMENIQRFKIDDLHRHLKTRYVAGNTVICVSGAYNKDIIPDLVEREFSSIADGKTLDANFGEAVMGRGPTVSHVSRPGSQTHVRVAFNAFGESDHDRTALSVLMGILDDGMSTRLHRRIFDELGLAYNVGADVEYYTDVGALNIDASTSPEKVADIVTQISRLTADLRDSPVDDLELLKAKKRRVWGLRDFLDDPHAMNSWYGEQELFRKPPLLEERILRIESIDSADVMRVARRIFKPINVHVTSVGSQNNSERNALEKAMSGF